MFRKTPSNMKYRLTLVGITFVVASAVGADTSTASCEELLAQPDVSLDEAVAKDCPLSAEQVSRLMDNPVGELISLPLQFDRLTLKSSSGRRNLHIETTKLIPTFPVRIGERWSLINRLVVPYVTVPFRSDLLRLPGIRPDAPIIDGIGSISIPLPGSTSGLGDLTYVGLITPRETIKTVNGKIVWAVGPTLVFPTAEEDILGQGKYQLGPALALGYLGRQWTIGTLAQHWWSLGGDNDRPSISQSNIQYFVYRKLPKQWAIGTSPNITIDWSGDDSPIVNAPIGIGINKTLLIGKLPVRFGLEATYYVEHESDIEPEKGLRFSATPVIPSAFLNR